MVKHPYKDDNLLIFSRPICGCGLLLSGEVQNDESSGMVNRFRQFQRCKRENDLHSQGL